MATIRNAIEIQDRFSSPLDRLNIGLQTAINRFTQLNTVMNSNPSFNGVDRLDAGLRTTQTLVNNVNNTLNNTNNILNNTTNNIQNINNHFGNTNSMIVNINNHQNQLNENISKGNASANGLLETIKKIATTYLGIQAIKGIFNNSDQFVQTKARLDLINDGLRTTDELQNTIFQSAQRSRASYSDTANVVAKLGTLAKSAFSNNTEMVAFAEQMNKQFKIGGASIQEQTAGMYQLTQAMASGKLQGDEFRSIMENAPLLAQAIATYTHKSMSELRKMSSEGQITADIIKKSLFSTAADTEARFAKIPKTTGEMWVSIKNQALMAFQPILTKINDIVNFNYNSMVNGLSATFSILSNSATSVIDKLVGIGAFFQNNWQSIKPVVMNIVGAIWIIFSTVSTSFGKLETFMNNNIGQISNILSRITGVIILVAATISSVVPPIIDAILNIANFVVNNWGIIEPIIWGIVAALGVYLIAMGLVNLANIASAVSTGIASFAADIYAASLAMQAGASFVATAAQYGLNAALLACPITWIIAAIIAVIVVLYVAVAVINRLTGSSISATGIIAGCFAMLGAHIYNVISYVWNVTSAYAEFFANVFTNPVYSVKRLFANLASNVLDMCIAMTSGFDNFATNMANAVISGINEAIGAWNSFVDLLSSAGIAEKLGLGKGAELSYSTSITSDLQNFKGQINDWVGEAPSDYWTAPRMDKISYGGAFDNGYAWGNNLSNSTIPNMNDFMDKFKLPDNIDNNNKGFNYTDLLNNAANNTGDTAKNTKDMKDKLDITDEDLKYLRDIAEQESINRFTTAEVKVEMTNHNSINNDMDIDGIIHHLGSGLHESLQTVAEGATYDNV